MSSSEEVNRPSILDSVAPLPYFLVDTRNAAYIRGQTGAQIYRQAESSIGFVVLLIFFIATAVLFFPHLFADVNSFFLRHSGVSTSATVIAHDYDLPARATHLTYQYTVDTGSGQQTFSHQENVQTAVANDAPKGGSVMVLYDRNNPANATLVATADDYTQDLPFAIITSLIALLFLILTIISGMLLRRHLLYDRQLKQNGKIVSGEVVASHGQSRGAKSPTYFVDIDYRFVNPVENQEQTGHVSFVRNDLMGKLPPQGTPVAVMYLDTTHHLLL